MPIERGWYTDAPPINHVEYASRGLVVEMVRVAPVGKWGCEIESPPRPPDVMDVMRWTIHNSDWSRWCRKEAVAFVRKVVPEPEKLEQDNDD